MSAHVLLCETKRPSNRLNGVESEEKNERRVEDVKEHEYEFALYHLVNVIEF